MYILLILCGDGGVVCVPGTQTTQEQFRIVRVPGTHTTQEQFRIV